MVQDIRRIHLAKQVEPPAYRRRRQPLPCLLDGQKIYSDHASHSRRDQRPALQGRIMNTGISVRASVGFASFVARTGPLDY